MALSNRTRKTRFSQWLIPAFVVLGALLALWYYLARVTGEDAAPIVANPPVDTAPSVPAAEHFPVPAEASGPADRPALVPLPALNDSDEYFRLEMSGVFGTAIDEPLVTPGIIEKIVATVDNLPNAQIAERIRPLKPVEGSIVVDGQDGSGEYVLNDSNYARYDGLIGMLTLSDLERVTDLYGRFYPLFQKAYEDLGYPDGYFNDRLVQVIDHLLETPEVSGPLELVRPNVLYQYRDPELEALSSGQKMLLRMGPAHREVVRRKLTELRALVTNL